MLYIELGAEEHLTTLRAAPPGAMWDAKWLVRKGPDGKSVVVKCPNGLEWYADERASNCGMPTDDIHRCWIRHGQVPNLTIDKVGVSCAAGAGSIVSGDYHGFIRNGSFTPG